MSDFIDFCRFMLFFVVAIALVIFSLAIVIYVLAENTCTGYQDITGNQTLYRPFDSCYVKIDGEWRRYDEHLARITAKDIK